jgi:hypothetical protein
MTVSYSQSFNLHSTGSWYHALVRAMMMMMMMMMARANPGREMVQHSTKKLKETK